MSERPRSEQGRFTRQRDPQEVFDAMEPGEPYVTSELADSLGWPRRTVYKALTELCEADKVVKKQANQRSVMWTRHTERRGEPS